MNCLFMTGTFVSTDDNDISFFEEADGNSDALVLAGNKEDSIFGVLLLLVPPAVCGLEAGLGSVDNDGNTSIGCSKLSRAFRALLLTMLKESSLACLILLALGRPGFTFSFKCELM